MKLIAMGGGACTALRRYRENCTHPDTTFAYLNTDANVRWSAAESEDTSEEKPDTENDGHSEMIRYKNGNCILVMGIEVTSYRSSGADYEVGIRAMDCSKDKIMQILKEDPQVILIGCCGGGTGSNIGVLTAWAERAGADFRVIYTMPYAFEGNLRRTHAELRTATLCQTAEVAARKDGIPAADHLCKVEYEEIKARGEQRGKKITLMNGFEEANIEIAKQIERLYETFPHK